MKKYFLTAVLISLLSCASEAPKNGGPDWDKASTGDEAETAGADELGEGDEPASRPKAQPMVVAEIYKKFQAARLAKQTVAAVSAAGEILAQNPGDVKVLNSLAAMSIEQKKLELARLYLNKVLEKDPKNASALNNLGVISLSEGDLRLALRYFKQATIENNRLGAAHANLGSIFLKYRNFKNAVEELRLAVDYGDESFEVLNNYAVALTWTGDFPKADSIYERVLAKSPGNVDVMLSYATLLIEKRKDPKAALKLLNKVRFVATDPAIIERAEELAREAELK